MDTCDKCGKTAELYHNEATGLAYCCPCDLATEEAANQAALVSVEYALARIVTLAEEAPGVERRELIDILGDIRNYAGLATVALKASQS